MYEKFFGLTDKPFSLTPNPRFVFYSRQYREAEGQLLYGISNREGFMLVTGEPGTGKTTLCRDLIEKLDRTKTQSALLFNPFLSGVEMLAALLMEFGIGVPSTATRKELLDRLNQFLLAQLALGKSCVAIFDEAQHLSAEFLEQIRVLSNLETDEEKLIQIILVGQPELLDRIRTPQMSQLDQRVSIRYTLTDLDREETDRYIHHRLNVAGARGQVRFSPRAVEEIYRSSHGVPRLINLISDRALLAGYAGQTRDIQPEHVQKAVAALRGQDAEVRTTAPHAAPRSTGRRTVAMAAVAAVLVAAVIGAGAMFWPRGNASSPGDTAYWHALAEPTASEVERDLGAFITGYPSSPHLDEALLRLAQLEQSRGDHAAAVDHLAMLAKHVPAGAMHTRAIVLGSLAGLDGGDTTVACQRITAEANPVTAGDTALTRQLRSLTSTCAARTSTASGTLGGSNAIPAGAPSDSARPRALADTITTSTTNSATKPKLPAQRPARGTPQ